MAKMVKSLTGLQHRILSLLKEWEDHHGLSKILDVIEMLLNLPLSTPLAKVVLLLLFNVFFKVPLIDFVRFSTDFRAT